jgi:hypothetical protein
MGWPLAASPGDVSEKAMEKAASGYLKRKLTRREVHRGSGYRAAAQPSFFSGFIGPFE